MIDAEKSDIFDVLAYIAFAFAPITRARRIDTHRQSIFAPYDEKLAHFIEFVLAQYVNEGVGELDEEKLPDLLQLRYQSVHDAAERLGGVQRIRDSFIGFQRHLYG